MCRGRHVAAVRAKCGEGGGRVRMDRCRAVQAGSGLQAKPKTCQNQTEFCQRFVSLKYSVSPDAGSLVTEITVLVWTENTPIQKNLIASFFDLVPLSLSDNIRVCELMIVIHLLILF